jgi:Protein of unknown function (DUF742)
MPTTYERWLDEDAGPVVRPYALTRGRTRPAGDRLDLIAIVTAANGARPDSQMGLDPEHLTLLRLCRLPVSVADLASDLDLPVGVVRILIGDLRERSLVRVHNPIPPARLPDVRILQEVVDGLRRL